MQQIRVGVASLSVFDSHLDQFRYEGGRFKLKSFYTFKISGSDSKSFLHNFFTTNVNNLEKYQFQITCRLTIQGRLNFYGYLICDKDTYYFIVPKYLKKRVAEEFEKYIITEDIEVLESDKQSAYFYADPLKKLNKGYSGSIFYESGRIIFQDEPKDNFNKVQAFTLKILNYLTGWPDGDEKMFYYDDKGEGALINNLPLNEIAVDYNKGCFLGQETAAKIHNNRGAAKYPCLIFIEENSIDLQPGDPVIVDNEKMGEVQSVFMEFDQVILVTLLKREIRLDDNEITLSKNDSEVKGLVKLIPFFSDQTNQAKSLYLMEEGQELFQSDENKAAKELLEYSIKLDPKNADAYESLGVILGREGNYDKAIKLMDKLQKVDPSSVMAHTNKSLYLMKQGKIEEAEEEKAQATVKTFEMYGREAKTKKEAEEELQKQKAERAQRANMFREVIELDPEDEFANIQLARIDLENENFSPILEKEEFLIEKFPNNPEVYYILSKVHLGNEKGISFLEKGLALAAKKGNQKILNDLNKIKKNL